MSDPHFQEAVAFGTTRDSLALTINPLASMGVSDEDYAVMVQNLLVCDDTAMADGLAAPSAQALSQGQKRTWDDDATGDVREGKRRRFEPIE